MKKIIIMLGVLISLTACHRSLKTNKSNQDSTKITATVKSDNITSKQPKPTEQDETALKLNTFYFDINDTNTFIYVVDSTYCIMLSSIFSYTYNSKDHVITVSGSIENPCENCTQYFKVFSGRDTRNVCERFPNLDMNRLEQLYNFTGNINNSAFSIIQLGAYSPTTGDYKVYQMNDWLNIYHPLTDGLNNQINSFIFNHYCPIKIGDCKNKRFLIE